MLKNRGLGKGLSAWGAGVNELLGTKPSETSMRTLAVNTLQPGRYQPRRRIDDSELEKLAASIKKHGVIQPIIVRKIETGYEIIAGERRWRAAKQVGLLEIPVVVREVDDKSAMVVSLIENIQREDLNAIEEALSLHRLITEFSLTHQEVADAVGKSRTTVTNFLRLLKLNQGVQVLVERGQLEMGHARALLSVDGDKQSQLAQLIAKQRLSVRQSEELIQQTVTPRARAHVKSRSSLIAPELQKHQNRLSEMLKTPVTIQQSKQGSGRLIVPFKDKTHLTEMLKVIASE